MKGVQKVSSQFRARARMVLAGVLASMLLVASLGDAHSASAVVGGTGGATTDLASVAMAAGSKWIDINLSRQTLTAYSGRTIVYSTRVSTGVRRYPTPVGTFRVYSKVRAQRMTGGRGRDYYSLPNVPHVMYFTGAYAIHGAYWHNNFGRPMSHGCVNLPLRAASWMYNWAPIGTPVRVHW